METTSQIVESWERSRRCSDDGIDCVRYLELLRAICNRNNLACRSRLHFLSKSRAFRLHAPIDDLGALARAASLAGHWASARFTAGQLRSGMGARIGRQLPRSFHTGVIRLCPKFCQEKLDKRFLRPDTTRMAQTKVRFIRLPIELDRQLQAVAKKEYRTVASLVRAAVELFLRVNKQ